MDDSHPRRCRPRVGGAGRGGDLRIPLRRHALLRLSAVLVPRLGRPRLRSADGDRARDRPTRGVPAPGDPRPPRGDGARVTALLEARGVTKSFAGVRAVDDASLVVADRSITALIGPNGAGKSTLFNCISGFLRPDAGHIDLGGKRIDRSPPHRIVRPGLARTFQTARALTRMTVLDNVRLAAPGHPGERLDSLVLRRGAVRLREREVTEQALDLLRLVRLDTHADSLSGTLSGGQRKLLDLARILMASPRMILLDQPVAAHHPA